jgi:hypothetical protein
LIEDPKWELAILATVRGFYERLLEDSLGGELPAPAGLEAISLQGDGDVHQKLERMRRWLRLLDLAITPAMLRQGFTPETDPEIAEAMLRYFMRKKDSGDLKRDKTDLVATFLYRHPRVPGQWERRGYGLDGSLPLSPFEIALLEILADTDVPSLPEEHVQLLRRFDQLQEEAQGFHDLNALVDSNIIKRVRELKRSLDSSFYHPGVLATVAPYNAVFGKKFDALFRAATLEIKNFAQTLEEQGGSILGNVDGVDVTVEHIAAMQECELLKMDYTSALEKFRRVSRLKKVLEQRPPVRRFSQPLSVPAPRSMRAPDSRPEPIDVQALRSSLTPQQIAGEEIKLRKVEESIRVFVRVADPKLRQVVPMRFFNLALSAAEADACCASYLEEQSLRANAARVLLRGVAVIARMSTELEELERVENSPSLYRLHADSLVTLLEIADTVVESGKRVIAEAGAQENTAPVEAVKISLGKLENRCQLVSGRLTEEKNRSQTV